MTAMTSDTEKRRWQQFLKHMDRLTAMALADLDAREILAQRDETPAFRFTLLAAAPAHGIELPDTEILSEGSDLSVSMTQEGDHLLVKLQLLGFAALEDYAGREARLKSSNRAIDYRFSFSLSGAATCLLSCRSDIREGLCDFAIFLTPKPQE